TSTTTASSAVVLAGGRSPAGLPASVAGSRVPRLVRGAGGAGAHSSHANTPVESGRRPTRPGGRGQSGRQTTQASPRSWAVVSPPGSPVGSPACPMSLPLTGVGVTCLLYRRGSVLSQLAEVKRAAKPWVSRPRPVRGGLRGAVRPAGLAGKTPPSRGIADHDIKVTYRGRVSCSRRY